MKVVDGGDFFSLPRNCFMLPPYPGSLEMNRFGQRLLTPLGVAAGPHTQMSQNIVAAWLCGARYIELKTIQTLDHLEVTKPCIDMEDEGYNCEWSQELPLEQSFREYLHAWIVIHILHRELRFSGDIRTVFNMSAGYNLEGIMQPNVQQFFTSMADCSRELRVALESVRVIYPAIHSLDIPSTISNNVTLSTMHGCPPEEIGKIARYLLLEKRLHTTIKLNPTLLGAKELRAILNDKLGYTTEIPDEAFGHDLKYPDAVVLIREIMELAHSERLDFGVKLTNTLESLNNRDVFAASESMMYMSGRPLHPISITLAEKLQRDFGGALDISFSAGADCFNIADIVSCGLAPVTVCSDLLKPGGYGRLSQYIENLELAMEEVSAPGTDDFILTTASLDNTFSLDRLQEAALKNLRDYAARVINDHAYSKDIYSSQDIKTSRPLGWFDCIHAPCTDTCATRQDIPEYLRHVAAGDFTSAFETITRTNPFPSVTGMVCDHLCQDKCTRIHYDDPVRIREIKRFASQFPSGSMVFDEFCNDGNEMRVAIIGSGPAGLSCGWFLRRAGVQVDLFEQKATTGGMVSAAIPAFRLTDEAVRTDIGRVLSSGIRFFDNTLIDRDQWEKLYSGYDAVFLAAGAQRAARLAIPGSDSHGVLDPLEFLFQVRGGQQTQAMKNVVIIGGGNTAMDAARTALRTVGDSGSVTIVYRRTRKEMPADHGEIKAVAGEGANIVELVSPVMIREQNGEVTSLVCSRTVLSLKGKDGRPVPVTVPGSEFEIPCDTVIPAIGQELGIDFLPLEKLKVAEGSYHTTIPGLFTGGDALRGASTAINAIADGRMAAQEIIDFLRLPEQKSVVTDLSPQEGISVLLKNKSKRVRTEMPGENLQRKPADFDLVHPEITGEEAMKEASRCLQCDRICDVCVSVCPNLANLAYQIEPVKLRLQKAVRMEDGGIGFVAGDPFIVEQSRQVVNIRDLCNECGNCTTFCPSSGRPFADKPGLCLSVHTLNDEGSGFFLSRLPDRTVLIFKEQGHIRTLSLAGGLYHYETEQVKAVIRPDDFSLADVKFLTPCVKEFHFTFAAEMSIVLKGALQLV
jgi:putative selenate reductase